MCLLRSSVNEYSENQEENKCLPDVLANDIPMLRIGVGQDPLNEIVAELVTRN